jgi:hypothetical protein
MTMTFHRSAVRSAPGAAWLCPLRAIMRMLTSARPAVYPVVALLPVLDQM